MKRNAHPDLLVPAILLLFALGIWTATAATLTQYWPFDDGGTSNSATNAVAGGNTASFVNFDTNAAWVASGLPTALTYSTAALALDGTDDYVNAGNILLKDKGTLSFWINPASYNGAVQIFSQVPFVEPFAGVLRFDTFGTGNIQVFTGSSWVDLAPVVPAGSWSHLALVYAYGTLQLWVNGVQQFPGANSGIDFDASNFGFGARFDLNGAIGGPYGLGYYGLLDDLSVWDGPVSSNSIALLATGTRPTAIQDVPVAGQLVQYWPFEEVSGATNAANAVPGGNTGMLTDFDSGTAWSTTDIAPNLAALSTVALAFDGTNDFVNLGNLKLNAEGTLSLWIKPMTVTSTNVGMRLFSHVTVPAAFAGVAAINIAPSGPGGIALYDKAWKAVSPDGALSPNAWHHLAFVFSKGLVTLFINGAPQLTETSRFNYDTAEMGLGAQFGGLGDTFNGLMDEVSIWNKALTLAAIQQLASGQSPLTIVDTTNQAPELITMKVSVEIPTAAQLVQYFPLDETTGLTASNGVPGGNTGYLSNYVASLAPWVTTGLPAALTNNPSAVSMDGSANYATLGNIGLTNSGTISLWIKPISVDGDISIFSHESGPPAHGSAGIFTGGGIRVHNGSPWITVAPAGTLTANQWAHLVFVYSGGLVTLFVNGTEQLTGTAGLGFDTASFGLGGRLVSAFGDTFGGLMDDLAIWDGPLSGSEIQNLTAGVSPVVLGGSATLVQYYPLNGSGSSLVVSNLVAGGNAGQLQDYSSTLMSWVTTDLPPMLSGSTAALFFDGANDLVNLGNLGLSGAGTISMWIRPATFNGDRRLFSPLGGIVGQAGGTGYAGSGGIRVWSGSAWRTIAPEGTLTTNQWAHLAFVCGGGRETLYVNGVEQQTVNTGFDFATDDFGLAARFLNLYGLLFEGLIDDVSIWDRPISPITVEGLAGGAKPSDLVDQPKNLVISWPAYPPGFTLEAAGSLPAGSNDWKAVVTVGGQVTVGTNWVATVPISSGSKYFRLKKN